MVTLDADNVAVPRAHRARQAAEQLAASTAWAGEDRIFCREDGSGIDPDWVSARFRKLCETAGVRRVRARHPACDGDADARRRHPRRGGGQAPLATPGSV
jgi:hypothetical protein